MRKCSDRSILFYWSCKIEAWGSKSLFTPTGLFVRNSERMGDRLCVIYPALHKSGKQVSGECSNNNQINTDQKKIFPSSVHLFIIK